MHNYLLTTTKSISTKIGVLAVLMLLCGSAAMAQVTIGGSVYGGGALANVNGNAQVDIQAGTVTGAVYGGGLGQKNGVNGATSDIAAIVAGTATVNIGKSGDESTAAGNSVYVNNVYGCNNLNGTPKDSVFVNIYASHRADKSLASYIGNDATYSITNVFGGGNQASYMPDTTGAVTRVYVYGCYNTIENLYGGGNAADVGTNTKNSGVSDTVDGGRFDYVFGGGNGAGSGNPGANIFGDVNLIVYAGLINHLFGGSNEKGNISGTKNLVVYNSGSCAEDIVEVFGGNNKAEGGGNVNLEIPCGVNAQKIGAIYGGSNLANLTSGSAVTLSIYGGTFDYVYGGSKGTSSVGADIDGSVTLNIHGGTIGSAFGGNNVKGNITGLITVNVLANQNDCPLDIDNVYGAGRDASYTPTAANATGNNHSPKVNILKGRVNNTVFGGGLGTDATVTANPLVTIGDATNTGYVATVGHTATVANPSAAGLGNVYGGGSQASVVGNTTVNIVNSNTVVKGSVFGAGKGVNDDYAVAVVTGNTTVNMSEGNVYGNVYGGGEMATVGIFAYTLNSSNQAVAVASRTSGGYTSVNISGGTVGIEELNSVGTETEVTNGTKVRSYGHSAGHKGHVYGGGLGKAGTNYALFAFVDSTRVNLSGTAYVVGSVFGGGENGHVLHNSGVHMDGGVVGQKLTYQERSIDTVTGAPHYHIYLGNVYGGGRGIDTYNGHFTATEGRVYGNTFVDIKGNSQVRHAVYGGGSLASVGTYNLDTLNLAEYTANPSTVTPNINHYYVTGTGEAHVKIYGSAFIGHNGIDLEDGVTDAMAVAALGSGKTANDLINANYHFIGANCGMVYGSGRGLAASEDNVLGLEYSESAFTSYTYVTIDGSAMVCGSVFGGGENGHVKHNTLVTIAGGIIGGIPMHNDGFNTKTAGFYTGTGAGHTLYNYHEDDEDEMGVGPQIYRGNVYGGGRGVDHFGANLSSGFSSTAGRVYGNTHVVVTGGTIYHDVFGGGSIASVGTYDELNDNPSRAVGIFGYRALKTRVTSENRYSDTVYMTTGVTTVDIEGGMIGTNGHNEGSVFGGGRGIAGDRTWQVTHLAYCDTARVNIKPGARIMGCVFGGGANGHVLRNSYVNMTGGLVGHALAGEDTLITRYGYAPRTVFRGNVYGGGRGVDPVSASQISATAGRVYGNTYVNISGGWVRHSVFGGGSMASVGNYELWTTASASGDPEPHAVGDFKGLQWINPEDNTLYKFSETTDENIKANILANVGNTYVTITDGWIGARPESGTNSTYSDKAGDVTGSGGEGRNNGHVFGSCRGVAGENYDGLAYVHRTHVVIGDQTNGTGPKIMGCVFGSGENGHVLDKTLVQMYGGDIGPLHKVNDWKRTYIGNLYGGGRGVDLDNNGNLSSTAGWVHNSTRVEMYGGHVWHNVYGGGSLASVGDLNKVGYEDEPTDPEHGRATVIIMGGKIGTDGDLNGNVFGSGRGRAGVNYDTIFHICTSNCTYVNKNTTVTVNGESCEVWTLRNWNNTADTLWLCKLPSAMRTQLGIASDDYMYIVLNNGTDKKVLYKEHDFSTRTYVINTQVIIDYSASALTGEKLANNTIHGSVYGSGDNGHVHHDSHVLFKNGYVGSVLNGANYQGNDSICATSGSVYGSGRGLDLTGVGSYSPAAGRVYGDTYVYIVGGKILRNVYGGGNMASVGWSETNSTGGITLNHGATYVYVVGGTLGDLTIEPVDNRHNGGNVFGSSRGLSSDVELVRSMAFACSTNVQVGGSVTAFDGNSYGSTATVTGSVFGGGENGHVMGNTDVVINPGALIGENNVYLSGEVYRGNVYGGGRGIDFTESSKVSRTSGAVYGNTKVRVIGGTIYHNVFGGGSLASVGRYQFFDETADYDGNNSDHVAIKDSIIQNIVIKDGDGNDVPNGKAIVIIGDGTGTNTATIGIDARNNGRVFGAGRGIALQDNSGNAFNFYTYVNNTEVTIQNGAQVNGCVFGSGDNGHTLGNTLVDVTGGVIGYDKGGPVNGNVFGSGRGADRGRRTVGGSPLFYSPTAGIVRGNTQVNITGGTIKNNVYGGGFMANVKGNTEVNIGTDTGNPSDFVIYGDIFGGSALGAIGSASGTTTINILSGTIGETDNTKAYNAGKKGNVFGGGNGDAGASGTAESVTVYENGTNNVITSRAADVLNAVQVNIGGASASTGKGNAVINGSVYGCNNIAGSPMSSVNVDIYKLNRTATSEVDYSAASPAPTYSLRNVFGGGNQADYTAENQTATVYIHYCSNTVQSVYGGGNAAAVPATSVTIDGGRFDTIFVGGNGRVSPANVGYLSGTPLTAITHSTGGTEANIYGGSYHYLFAGSNMQGSIRGATNTLLDPSGSDCDFFVDNFFGGGNMAAGGGGTINVLCGTHFTNFYGGANNADINGDIVLNIQGGIFENIFGGNNAGGTVNGDVTVNFTGGHVDNLYGGNNAGGNITGTITVNVDVDPAYACADGLLLDYVYGGGKDAAYTPTLSDPATATPTVNIINDNLTIDVYGGGYGSTATVTANPKVVIGTSATGKTATIRNNVYGGGNAAPVVGNTNVQVLYQSVIRNNVFGGGNAAPVTGNTEVLLGGHSKTFGNVYGGGNMGEVTGNTKVIVNSD